MIHRLNNNCLFIFSFLTSAYYYTSFVEGTVGASDDQLAKISLRLYLGSNAKDGNHVDELVGSGLRLLEKFDPVKPSVVYIHGFTENLDAESVRTVVNAYLKRRDHNVVAVDWSEIASQNYATVLASAEGIGKILAKFFNTISDCSLDVNKLHVVGHSLGGQICGFIGRNVNFELARIIALDPAGPGFVLLIKSLSYKDAKFVQIIHTDSGIYGNAKPSGTADFYPNGGKRMQPGCPFLYTPLTEADYCSHHRSWQYYAESVVNETSFVGVRCECKLKFYLNKCKNNKTAIMGFATPFETKGIFYLSTNDKKPFGRGEEGVYPFPKSKFHFP